MTHETLHAEIEQVDTGIDIIPVATEETRRAIGGVAGGELIAQIPVRTHEGAGGSVVFENLSGDIVDQTKPFSENASERE